MYIAQSISPIEQTTVTMFLERHKHTLLCSMDHQHNRRVHHHNVQEIKHHIDQAAIILAKLKTPEVINTVDEIQFLIHCLNMRSTHLKSILKVHGAEYLNTLQDQAEIDMFSSIIFKLRKVIARNYITSVRDAVVSNVRKVIAT
jgi:hypothetical protein